MIRASRTAVHARRRRLPRRSQGKLRAGDAHLDQTYRNLALHRPAYQSSSYDYNLTAQLITDGIKDTRLPRWVAVSTSETGRAQEERARVAARS